MLVLPYDLQRLMLVRGAADTTKLTLPTFTAGASYDITALALLPTGDPTAPYAGQTITGGLLTFCAGSGATAQALVSVALVNVAGAWQVSVTLPTSGVVPAGSQYADGTLQADLTTTAGGPYHVETGIVLRDPSFPIAIPDVGTIVLTPDDIGTTAGTVAAGNDARIVNAYANYPQMAASAVDGAIAGLTPSFTPLAGTGTQNFFSVYNPAIHAYARNPACIAPWPSFVSCWNSANADGTGGNRGCVTMLNATQGITNNHFAQPYAVGVRHDFADGSYALVQSSAQVGATDFQIVTFDRALPASVGVASGLTVTQAAAVLQAGAPLLFVNQQKQAVVAEFVADSAGTLTIQSAAASNRTAWTSTPIVAVGDSDGPVFVGVNGQWVPLTTIHEYNTLSGTADGPSLSANLAAVNAALTNGKVATAAVNLLPVVAGGGYFRSDIVAPTTAQDPRSLQSIANPSPNQRVDFADSQGVFYSWKFSLGSDGSDTPAETIFVRDVTLTGAWYLICAFDPEGQEGPAGIIFPSDVYANGGSLKLGAGTASANVNGLRFSAGPGSTDTAATGAQVAGVLGGATVALQTLSLGPAGTATQNSLAIANGGGSVTHFNFNNGGANYLRGSSFQVDCATLIVNNLPTTDPHAAGQFWRSGNTVMISTG